MSPRSEQRVQLLRSELEPDAHGGADLYTINCDVEVLHVLAGVAHRAVRRSLGDGSHRRRPHLPGSRTAHLAGEEEAPATVCWVLVPAPWSGSA